MSTAMSPFNDWSYDEPSANSVQKASEKKLSSSSKHGVVMQKKVNVKLPSKKPSGYNETFMRKRGRSSLHRSRHLSVRNRFTSKDKQRSKGSMFTAYRESTIRKLKKSDKNGDCPFDKELTEHCNNNVFDEVDEKDHIMTECCKFVLLYNLSTIDVNLMTEDSMKLLDLFYKLNEMIFIEPFQTDLKSLRGPQNNHGDGEHREEDGEDKSLVDSINLDCNIEFIDENCCGVEKHRTVHTFNCDDCLIEGSEDRAKRIAMQNVSEDTSSSDGARLATDEREESISRSRSNFNDQWNDFSKDKSISFYISRCFKLDKIWRYLRNTCSGVINKSGFQRINGRFIRRSD